MALVGSTLQTLPVASAAIALAVTVHGKQHTLRNLASLDLPMQSLAIPG
jgi:hypothetical protein